MSEFDLTSPEFLADPYPTLKAVREATPLYRSKMGWLVTRYEHANSVLRDFRTWGAGITGERRRSLMQPGPMLEYASRRLNGYDPQEHGPLRSLVTKGLTAKRVEALKPHIQAIADALLDAVRGVQEFDVIQALAHPLPAQVICEMIGVPLRDSPILSEWTEAMQMALAPVARPSQMPAANRAADGFMSYVRALVAQRRSDPGDDLVSALVSAEENGQRLTEEELVAIILFMFSAGHSTTRDLVGGGLIALMNNRKQWERLIADPSLIPSAVEECLRYMPSITLTFRRALRDATLADTSIAAGDIVLVSIPGANRDPRRFPDPDVFDIARGDNEHLTFGGGVYYCLGAALARAEAQIILTTLAKRYPRMRLREQTIEWRDAVAFRGPKRLLVSV